MTFKKLYRKLQQEQFDVEGYDVVFEANDGEETIEIEDVRVDEDNKRVVFSASE
jgi:hypothetical protein